MSLQMFTDAWELPVKTFGNGNIALRRKVLLLALADSAADGCEFRLPEDESLMLANGSTPDQLAKDMTWFLKKGVLTPFTDSTHMLNLNVLQQKGARHVL